MKGGIIYLAESPSEKEYIGQTVQSLARRKQQHEKEARRGSDNPFHAAIRKYGAENIKWKIIARADNIAALNAAEIRLLLPNIIQSRRMDIICARAAKIAL